jgi:hypothetical protein
LILGYRRYLWRGLSLEYVLMPSYNWFLAQPENVYYNGFELWNELRAGCRFDFAGRFYVLPQWLFGFALYGGNKPQSFKDEASAFFTAPMLFLGMRL